ncbi:MAG: hypothetical protein ACRDEA_12240 [Microcystaceae cyanobacterium]
MKDSVWGSDCNKAIYTRFAMRVGFKSISRLLMMAAGTGSVAIGVASHHPVQQVAIQQPETTVEFCKAMTTTNYIPEECK